MRLKVQYRDSNGKALETYRDLPYVPRVGDTVLLHNDEGSVVWFRGRVQRVETWVFLLSGGFKEQVVTVWLVEEKE